ncbi:MAG: AraC family transcriptional regulator [Acidobacteria bacterium]|nr:AraC family transcriptional regulator [Acidobacteriota bacterium]MBV9018433.1 AraC family transcriptional regulator [Alphaproteobacteria bacterium]
MSSSVVRIFADPDDYAVAMRQGTVGLTITQRGAFTAKLSRVDLHRLWMQRFSANLGWTAHIDYWGGWATIAFQTRPGSTMLRDGRECAYDSISLLSTPQSYYLNSPGSPAYGTISLQLDEMAGLGAALGKRYVTAPDGHLIRTPPRSALSKLRRLHEAAGDLAEDAPAVVGHPEAARGLEQALIGAMIDCLRGEVYEDRAAQRQHAMIMRRFHSVVEQHLEEPLYIPELCKAVGASERTLQACCQEHLSMSPKRFLLLRRMHLVRKALHRSTPFETTVTKIATRYGFWQLGRFAVEYKALFGESPSATLARPV